jgi:integrase
MKGWRSELTHLKAVIHRLHRLGFCSEQVIKDLNSIQKPRAEQKPYPDIPKSKIKEILLFMKSDRPECYAPLYFIYRTGRRIEETLLIEKGDVKWLGLKLKKIAIRGETTKSGRNAPLEVFDQDLESHIRKAYQRSIKHKAPYLLLNERNRKSNQKAIRRYLKKVSKEKIGDEITPHYFRHRFFTECAKANMSIPDVKAISGINDTKVLLEYYTHNTPEGQRKVLEITKL